MALRIMAVDDELEVLKLFKMILEPLGVEVLTTQRRRSHRAGDRVRR